MARIRRPACSERRACLRLGSLLLLPPALLLPRRGRATAYPITAQAMREAQVNEMGVYYRYTEFGRRARQDGYAGIAYLFAAFAAAEFVHAGNFGRIQARLGIEVPPVAKPDIGVGSTRDNLMAAADGEIRSVDEFYPRMLERIRPEGHADAMAAVNYAWETEKRHRDKIRQVQRWSPSFFEQVAKVIDQKTGQYYVCQLCGCTLNQLPATTCPVCRNAATQYRHIEPPA
ncbi:MAG: hypothetical protein JNL87_11645 [Burkholderiaceae bacterium]|nr:hypothetical protein [Burkholderiaceae bacterium]